MAIAATVSVACPACGEAQEATLVQSVNARVDAGSRAQLLDGTLNVHACTRCGHRTQLVATLVYHDPDRELYVQVVPRKAEVAGAAAAFAASGATGTLRIVPSQNALVEKVKIADAGLADWAIEMAKVLLLAAETDELNEIVLFDGIDRAAGTIRWLRIVDGEARPATSAASAYAKLATSTPPGAGEYEIDRAWAVDAVQRMIAAAN